MIVQSTNQIEFSLERKQAPYCYLIGEILVEAKVTIRKKKDNTLPDNKKIVSTINPCLHGLFKSVIVKLNNQQISSTPDGYHYKSYLSHLLTYDPQVKSSSLSIAGWSTDSFSCMDGSLNVAGLPQNNGFAIRSSYFREDFVYTGVDAKYKESGATFIGRLGHELANSRKPLPTSKSSKTLKIVTIFMYLYF
jgi:hypothetical protein